MGCGNCGRTVAADEASTADSVACAVAYVSFLPRVSITESFSRRYRVDAGITVSSSTPTKVKEAMVANSVITSIG